MSKKREPKSYDMKLVLVDFICEVNDTGKTESYDGSVLLEPPFRVGEMNRTLPFKQGFLPLLNLDFLCLTKLFCTPPDRAE